MTAQRKAADPTPMEVAQEAGLRYVSDARPGITRRRVGRGFSYRDQTGEPLHHEAHRARIRSLAIPPAWTDVWISRLANGHLQATGRDARGRKQYRYHARWRSVRDEDKFDRTISFAMALPTIRKAVAKDIQRAGLPRQKALAAVVRLLETTFIRVGNTEYARDNDSFGLTTMRNKHAAVEGTRLTFRFKGKSGRTHRVELRDRRLANIVRRCQEIPGQELFAYLDDDDVPHDVTSDDVNAYLREISGQDFTAKDFRTWAGTVLAAQALRAVKAAGQDGAPSKKGVARAIEEVARSLGNTPTVCRQCYVHPAIIDAYLDGTMVRAARQRVEEELARDTPGSIIDTEERAVLRLLRKRLSQAQSETDQGRRQTRRASA